MRVLIACEESQEVCKAFRTRGHEAYSCDLQDCSGGHPEWHIKGDAREPLTYDKWDLVIAHPPCTRLSNSGVRWLKERNLWKDLDLAIMFFKQFLYYGLKNPIAIENPIPHGYAVNGYNNPITGNFTDGIGEYSQIIQPYQFGHMEKKATCLWLSNLPKLIETNNVYEEMMKLPYAERAKVHYASPGKERAKIRSKTYSGIAQAMAEQWGEGNLCK